MEPLGRKATKSGSQGTRLQASGCVRLQVGCGPLGPQRGPWPVPAEGGRRPATAKGAAPAAPPDWPEANLAPGPHEEGVSSPRPLKTAGAGGLKGNKCPPAPAWPHLPQLHWGQIRVPACQDGKR